MIHRENCRWCACTPCVPWCRMVVDGVSVPFVRGDLPPHVEAKIEETKIKRRALSTYQRGTEGN
jgi:hypothetical protein